MPTDPPGGRTTFVVAIGKLRSGTVNEDWVRVGSYTFDPQSHTVTTALWAWRQSAPTNREHSGVTPNATCSEGAGEVRACDILIPAGYRDAPNDNRTGSYEVRYDAASGAPYVRIAWNANWYEEWWLPTSDAEGYVVLRYKQGSASTVGFAYGSQAPLSERRAYSTIVQKTGLYYEKWARKQACSDCQSAEVTRSLNPSNHFQQWTVCGDGLSWVMTHYDPESSGDCSGATDTSIQFYMMRPSGTGRRDAWWFWHSCKAGPGTPWNECYGCDNSDRHGGSHDFALVQVLNDSGQYVGHIGVEVGFDEGSCNNPSEERYSDVLSVVRLTPETRYLNDPEGMP